MCRILTRVVCAVLVCAGFPAGVLACPPPVALEHDWTVTVFGEAYGFRQTRAFDPGAAAERYLLAGDWYMDLDDRWLAGGAVGGAGCWAIGMAIVAGSRARSRRLEPGA